MQTDAAKCHDRCQGEKGASPIIDIEEPSALVPVWIPDQEYDLIDLMALADQETDLEGINGV